MNKNHTNELDYAKLVMPRQLVLPLDYRISIKETAPVRLLDAVLEELNYKELQHFLFYYKTFKISSAIALAINGGTAFPTCVYCGTSTRRLNPPVVLFPKNSNESSKD